jgi:hypothetical protein
LLTGILETRDKTFRYGGWLDNNCKKLSCDAISDETEAGLLFSLFCLSLSPNVSII